MTTPELEIIPSDRVDDMLRIDPVDQVLMATPPRASTPPPHDPTPIMPLFAGQPCLWLGEGDYWLVHARTTPLRGLDKPGLPGEEVRFHIVAVKRYLRGPLGMEGIDVCIFRAIYYKGEFVRSDGAQPVHLTTQKRLSAWVDDIMGWIEREHRPPVGLEIIYAHPDMGKKKPNV